MLDRTARHSRQRVVQPKSKRRNRNETAARSTIRLLLAFHILSFPCCRGRDLLSDPDSDPRWWRDECEKRMLVVVYGWVGYLGVAGMQVGG
jgi:hypothetical protein